MKTERLINLLKEILYFIKIKSIYINKNFSKNKKDYFIFSNNMSLNHTRYNSHEESMRKKNNESKINQNIEKDEITNYDFKQEINIEPEFISIEKNNIFNSLLSKYREEIKFLKEYINRLHKELRKNLNIEIPFLEEFEKINILKEKKGTLNNINNIYNLKGNNLSDINEVQEEIKLKSNNSINHSNNNINNNKNENSNILDNSYNNIIKINNTNNNNINSIKSNLLSKFNLEKDNEISLNMNFLKSYLDEASSYLINVDYINPILIIYDKHFKNLSEEIENLKKINKNYEKKILEFTQENKTLRETILVKASELKNLINIKVESVYNTGIIYDEEYFQKLDERNNFLSKENEIILLNYQKVYNEYVNFQTNYLEKHNDNMKKVEIFDKIYEQLNHANLHIDGLILKNQICENKISELVEKSIYNENEMEAYKIESQKLRMEIQRMNESIDFYKNFVAKMNI